jgi:hypothetical protein
MEKYKIENCVCLLYPFSERLFEEVNKEVKAILKQGLGFLDSFTTYGLIPRPIKNQSKVGGALIVIPFESLEDIKLFKSRITEYSHLLTDLFNQDDLDRMVNKEGFTRLRNNRFSVEIVEEWKKRYTS